MNLSAVSAAECNVGDTVALIGVAAGGKGEYHYNFFYKKHTSEQWNRLGTKNGTVCVVGLTPGKAVDYDIMIVVSDDNGSVESEVFTLHVLPKALENNSTVDTDKIVVNQTVTITGAADGGRGSYTYTYLYKKSKNTDWVTIKNSNISGNTATFKPTAATDYDIKVIVTDSEGKTSEKVMTLKYETSLVNNATISTETVTVGNKVVLKGAAAGGAGGYQYAFYYKKSKNSTWTAISENTAKSAAFKPGSAVSYDAKVVVTDADGKTAEKIFTVSVTK